MRNHKFIRIFVETPLSEGISINLNKEQSHYLINVMRRQEADEILLFNGKDGEFISKIVEASKNQARLEVLSKNRQQKHSPDITLCYSPVKNAKNEFIVQKATEMGVSAIQPMITERTIKDKARSEKLRAVAIEAAEQCERLDIPVINEIEDIQKLLPKLKNYNLMLCDETGKGGNVADVLQTAGSGAWAILIGPEGGFSEAELTALYDMKNIFPVSLGPRILRAETAIITAIALWQNYLGDFRKFSHSRVGGNLK